MPGSASNGRLLSTIRLRTRVMEGGRIEVIWPGLPAGAAVEVEVHLEEAVPSPQQVEPPASSVRAPVREEAGPARGDRGVPAMAEGEDLAWWLDALPVTRRTPPREREDWEMEQPAS